MGPIFDQLKSEMSGGRIKFLRYAVPADKNGGPIIEDLISKGYIYAAEEKDPATGAVTQTADLGCFAGTGRICVFDATTLAFVGEISASHSYESARDKISGMLAD